MSVQHALRLVREKYLEEQQGKNESNVASRYRTARESFPATMDVAHQIWAREIMKELP